MNVFTKSWNATGVLIVSYGWTRLQRRPLINFTDVSSHGSIFLKTVDGSKI